MANNDMMNSGVYTVKTASQIRTDEFSDHSVVRKIGAYHMIGDDSYEPQRNNNFELRVYGLDNLNYVGNNPNSIGTHVNQDEAESCLTLSTVSVGSITTTVGVIPIAYGNTKVKFAGLPEVQNTGITYNDYIGKNTERIISAWFGLVFNPNTQKIGRASNYKKPALLIETAPDGTQARTWLLKGCFPNSVQYGDYDYNGGQVRQIQMELTYDIAIPLEDLEGEGRIPKFVNTGFKAY